MPFNRWIGLALALIIGFVLSLVFRWVFKFGKSITKKRLGEWNDLIFTAAEGPAGLLSACAFWWVAISVLDFEGRQLRILNVGIQILVAIAFVWGAYGLIDVLLEGARKYAIKTESPIDDHMVKFGRRVLKATVLLIGFMVIFQHLGFNVGSLVTGLGLGGLAIALAAKDTLANLFATIMIIVDKPFKIGDLIRVRDMEGTVEEIGFRSTQIRTGADSLVSIPNSNLANDTIDNLGRRQYRRVKTVLALPPDSHPEDCMKLIAALRELVLRHQKTRKDDFDIALQAVSSISIELLFCCYVRVMSLTEELEERQAILLEVLQLVRKTGLHLMPPIQMVRLENTLKSQ